MGEPVIKADVTESLRRLRIGESVTFPAGSSYGSVRTVASRLHILIKMRTLPSGEFQVTRKANRGKPQVGSEKVIPI